MTDLTFEIPRGVVLNSNGRHHWATKARNTRHIRGLAKTAALNSGQVADPPVTITATIQYARAGRHDAHNLQPTVKALIDGLVDGGLLIDDSDEYVHAVIFKASIGRGRVGHTTIHINLEEVS